ncbi:GNAT superfamily N-acetyltransferase [Sphingomonas naasensis]|uniref:GNAT family N-acetyltransferase n=1 Tax=Sphingomonas naasensis TaxID=1344951 RepID=A0A4S1WHV5_9SPHN|nr:GNAT family N-acetyltransferase [Sphingomonas naasensis]NIJ22084.1 GNAT superfamily N-acetyltransferase [Sphingomonas naasensis]TGX42243.1 GNAT family N-acetyltransferase [Sphingomonas naasensis]
MEIRDAVSSSDFAAVAALMRAFIQWHYARHARDRHIIDSYFEPAAFEAELDALPGEFAPPAGALLVAEAQGRILGCVALRPLADGSCEMKRMFVDPDYHGAGAGRALAEAVIERARALGYVRMLLDTGPAQKEAQGLYRALGFRDVAPYYDLPPLLRDWLVFMERDLIEAAPTRS